MMYTQDLPQATKELRNLYQKCPESIGHVLADCLSLTREEQWRCREQIVGEWIEREYKEPRTIKRSIKF